MKKLLQSLLLILPLGLALAVGPAHSSPFLTVDPCTDGAPQVIEVEVTHKGVTTVVAGMPYEVINNRVRILDLAGRSSGSYAFRARWHDGSGWWSEWGPVEGPFVSGKLGNVGTFGIEP